MRVVVDRLRVSGLAHVPAPGDFAVELREELSRRISGLTLGESRNVPLVRRNVAQDARPAVAAAEAIQAVAGKRDD
jgi:hypothetical protein